ncbi:exocyst complex component Sec10-domain-containing protein [Fimicolochytrium jonesii]|uniref:exocyst complex component Sec10-domain-containing protein n=1 Tax=Fimicolochytrium jonesii TaxID=1396493 RepID=UPI0022FEE12B|nr:exocyst complex component Sec10-domain-containing protein [Fimicolochytrium jonesii]KAI8822966.1 exocyst complex component Sec10-domain-containing protein [Fimicolochytrium jonesii]
MLNRKTNQPAAPAAPPKTIASLPPDLVIRTFTFLPVADLSSVARVSRRFKILAYNDEVYEPKLRALQVGTTEESAGAGQDDAAGKENDASGLVELLSTRLRQMPGGHMLPGSTKYLETGTLWGSLTDKDDSIQEEGSDKPVAAEAVTPGHDLPTPVTPSLEKAAAIAIPEDEADISVEAPLEDLPEDDEASARPSTNAEVPAAPLPISPVSPQQLSITSALPTSRSSNITIGQGGLKGLERQSSRVSVGSVKRAPRLSTQNAREIFKQMYINLSPYYYDFRKRQKDSKVFKDFKDLSEVAMILRKLKLFSEAHFVPSSDDIQFALDTTIEWFESMLLGQFERAYDGKNLKEMKRNAYAAYFLNGGGAVIQLFISKNPVFFDPTYNPALIINKVPMAGTAPAAGYTLADDFAKFSDYTLNNCREQARVIAQVFPAQADALTLFVNKVFEDSVAEYLSGVLAASKEREGLGVYLHTLATGIYCCMQFAEFIAHNDAGVPVQTDKLKDVVMEICKPYTSTYMKLELEHMNGKFHKELSKWGNRKGDPKKKKAAGFIADQDKAAAHKRQVMNTMKSIMFAPVAFGKMVTGVGNRGGGGSKDKPHRESLLENAEPVTHLPVEQEDNVTYHLDDNSINSLVSLELCLHLMHTNKEALGRVLVITSATDATKIRRNVERVFCALLDVVGPNHIKPAFDAALARLSDAKLADASEEKAVNPESLQFFELVHIADLIQQMIEVYYQEDVKSWIDESDFLSDIVTEKKAFERLLDDCVASGMDKSIQVLVNQVEYILLVEQKPTDYNPAEKDVVMDLKPTRACLRVIDTLNSHAKILYGVAEKHTMEVFFGEVGVRIFNVICKNIKRLQVSQTGAMQLIIDLNTFYEWSCTLKVSSVKKMFEVLKEVGNLFLADGGDELRKLVHDLPRYQGQLRIEEIYELLASRTDYKKIQKYMETKDCVIQ